MGLALVVLVGAALVGLALGGSLAGLSSLRLHGLRLLVASVVAQLLGGGLAAATGGSGWYVAGLLVSALTALAFCLRNLRVAGLTLVALGFLLNAAVVARNGAMPVSVVGAARANVSVTAIAEGSDPRHAIAAQGTGWRWLGDVVPVPLPLRPEVASPGDVLVVAGLGELVVLAVRRRRRLSPDRKPVVPWRSLPG